MRLGSLEKKDPDTRVKVRGLSKGRTVLRARLSLGELLAGLRIKGDENTTTLDFTVLDSPHGSVPECCEEPFLSVLENGSLKEALGMDSEDNGATLPSPGLHSLDDDDIGDDYPDADENANDDYHDADEDANDDYHKADDVYHDVGDAYDDDVYHGIDNAVDDVYYDDDADDDDVYHDVDDADDDDVYHSVDDAVDDVYYDDDADADDDVYYDDDADDDDVYHNVDDADDDDVYHSVDDAVDDVYYDDDAEADDGNKEENDKVPRTLEDIKVIVQDNVINLEDECRTEMIMNSLDRLTEDGLREVSLPSTPDWSSPVWPEPGTADLWLDRKVHQAAPRRDSLRKRLGYYAGWLAMTLMSYNAWLQFSKE